MPLSPRLLATWLHYHQLHEGVSILGQRTWSKGTSLRYVYIVCRSPHWHLSEEVRHYFCRLAAHNPVFVRKRFSNDHVRRGNSKPSCRTVGSDTSALLVTIAESQTSCHLVFLYQKWSSPTTVVGVGLTVFSGKDFLRRCFSGMGWWAKRVRQVWCADAAADESEWAFVTKCHNGVVTVRQYTGGDTRHDGNEYWWTLLLDT